MPNTQTVQPGTPPLLHIGVVAEQLGLSVYQVKRLIDDGRLSSERIGARIYVPTESLSLYVASLARESA